MRAVQVFAAMMGLLLLTGCAMNSPDDSVTPEKRIADAKSQTQQLEMRVAGLVPGRDVDKINQLSKGTLLSCESGDKWAGGITIDLSPDVAPSSALSELAEKATGAGLEVHRSRSFNGTERVTVSEAGGASLLLDVATHSIEGGSFSACFPLPAKFYRGGDF